MRRIGITIEYDGTDYAGWQRQENALAVQQVIEDALSKLTNVPTVISGASRTDAGVHALGQVAHFDTDSSIPSGKFSFALNTMLPDRIRITHSQQVSGDFHARFMAKGKRYIYRIYSAPHASALYRNLSAHVIYPLDVTAMQKEAQFMIGTHDFSAFAASGSVVKDTVRTVTKCEITNDSPFITLTIEGTGFLYNMVRIVAGTLILVGTGKLEPGAITRAIESKNRLDLGPTAPAQGLVLVKVYYDERDYIP